ncbi:hypothetical protein [Exiguobacterium undae]|uniref:Uncharacterized protein n=1 Tax=Exiguobacterium undae TaxID=169177 RepID=A0ABX2VBM6_9BACL|nr:hypothetical protein [Exiguobacterium undae]OAN15642.1 hypothetical protein A3783_06815 [Exiguobacterium undae]
MSDPVERLPFYLKRFPFFVISYIVAPLASLLLLIHWKSLRPQTRDVRLIVSSLFLLLFLVDFFPRGWYQNAMLAFAITVGLFITFIGLEGKQSKHDK